MSLLYPPNPWCEWCTKVGHTTGVYVPCSFEQWCEFFYVPQKLGVSSLSEKTRKSNHLQMSLQKQHFLLSYLKTLSVRTARVWTRDLLLSRPALSQPSQPGGGVVWVRELFRSTKSPSISSRHCGRNSSPCSSQRGEPISNPTLRVQFSG